MPSDSRKKIRSGLARRRRKDVAFRLFGVAATATGLLFLAFFFLTHFFAHHHGFAFEFLLQRFEFFLALLDLGLHLLAFLFHIRLKLLARLRIIDHLLKTDNANFHFGRVGRNKRQCNDRHGDGYGNYNITHSTSLAP